MRSATACRRRSVDRDSSLCLQVDALYQIDSRSFYIEGWSRSDRRSPSWWSSRRKDGRRSLGSRLPLPASRRRRVPRRDRVEPRPTRTASSRTSSCRTARRCPPAGSCRSSVKDGSGVEVAAPAVTTDERLGPAIRSSATSRSSRFRTTRLRRRPRPPGTRQDAARARRADGDRAGRPVRRAAGATDRVDRRAALQAHRLPRAPAGAVRARPGDPPGRPDLRARLARGRGVPARRSRASCIASTASRSGSSTSPGTAASPSPTTSAPR